MTNMSSASNSNNTDKHALTERIKSKALELGFARVGVTSADPIDGYEDRLLSRQGYDVLWDVQSSDSRLRKAARTMQQVPEAKSVISLVRAVSNIDFPEKLLAYAGRIYLGRCYVPPGDTVEGKRITLFEEFLASCGITSLYNHTNMQLVDRAIAARAGNITYGKNNFAYAGDLGSFIVMISIPVDVELEYEDHAPTRPCPPNCRLCIDACPTQAMDGDGNLNPTRCVLYSNFLPGDMKDMDVTDLIGTRIHGCDACQEACPRNKRALGQPKTKDPYLEWLVDEFSLEKLLFCDDDYYAQCVRPIMFNYIRDIDIFRQNAAIAMGNSGDPAYIPALQQAVESGSDQVKRFAQHAIDKLSAI